MYWRSKLITGGLRQQQKTWPKRLHLLQITSRRCYNWDLNDLGLKMDWSIAWLIQSIILLNILTTLHKYEKIWGGLHDGAFLYIYCHVSLNHICLMLIFPSLLVAMSESFTCLKQQASATHISSFGRMCFIPLFPCVCSATLANKKIIWYSCQESLEVKCRSQQNEMHIQTDRKR